jgi:hypothetical protein
MIFHILLMRPWASKPLIREPCLRQFPLTVTDVRMSSYLSLLLRGLGGGKAQDKRRFVSLEA